ncbi:MAG: type II secretion system protein [Deltaproteobacteria bacterium]|nr:type II secretion system protein [Deltaproteobacteria bacterium]
MSSRTRRRARIGARDAGFTLVEALLVLVIAALGASLVGPRFFQAYEGIRRRAEERTRNQLVTVAQLRAFLEDEPLTLASKERRIELLRKGEVIWSKEFVWLSLEPETHDFGRNGFESRGRQ